MKNLLFFLTLSLISLNLSAEGGSFFKLSAEESNKVKISLTNLSDDAADVELYRINKNGVPINIYEFKTLSDRFFEDAELGACYLLKIYFEDGRIVETDKQCYTPDLLLTKSNNLILFILAILLISLTVPMIFKKAFPYQIDRNSLQMLKFIKTIIAEDAGRIAFNNSMDSKLHPLFAATIGFADEIASANETGSSLTTTIPEEFKTITSQCDGNGVISFAPLPNADNAFYTTVKKRDFVSLLILNISDGSVLSDWDVYNSNTNRAAFSLGVEGFLIDSINAQKCLISIEPFLLEAQTKNENHKKTLNISGAYLFLAMISLIILFFSILKTLTPFCPSIAAFLNYFGLIS